MDTRDTETVEILTLEEYEQLPEQDGYRDELVRGRLVRDQLPGAEHGWLVAKLFREIEAFVRERGLGLTVIEAGFVLEEDPPTVRGPDVAFIAEEDLPLEGISRSFWRVPPTLAVEVVSPSNKAADIQEKVLNYLDAGARLVWVVDPRTGSVTAYRSRSDIRLLRGGDVLDGADVLPGFAYPIADLFAPYQPRPT